MGFQSGINRLLGLGAAFSTAKQITEPQSEMNKIKVNTAQEKLKNIKLKNKNMRLKNKALQNMQDVGKGKIQAKQDFDTYYQGLKNNPPILGGSQNAFSNLSPKAQKSVAEQLYKMENK